MTLQDRIRTCCEARTLIFDETGDIYKIAPDVYIVHAYDPGTRRLKRYKAVDKGDLCVLELY